MRRINLLPNLCLLPFVKCTQLCICIILFSVIDPSHHGARLARSSRSICEHIDSCKHRIQVGRRATIFRCERQRPITDEPAKRLPEASKRHGTCDQVEKEKAKGPTQDGRTG